MGSHSWTRLSDFHTFPALVSHLTAWPEPGVPVLPPSAGHTLPLPAAFFRSLRVPVPTGVSQRKAAGPHLQLPGQPGRWTSATTARRG